MAISRTEDPSKNSWAGFPAAQRKLNQVARNTVFPTAEEAHDAIQNPEPSVIPDWRSAMGGVRPMTSMGGSALSAAQTFAPELLGTQEPLATPGMVPIVKEALTPQQQLQQLQQQQAAMDAAQRKNSAKVTLPKNPYKDFSSNMKYNPQERTDYNDSINKYSEIVGDVSADPSDRLAQQDARLTKEEDSNLNTQLMQFGLGMLGKKDFYGAMGDSGAKALTKYTQNKVRHRKARDVLGDKRAQLEQQQLMQQQRQRVQALGLAQADATAQDALNAANEKGRFAASAANHKNDTDRAQIQSRLTLQMQAATNLAAKATEASDKAYQSLVDTAAKNIHASTNNTDPSWDAGAVAMVNELMLLGGPEVVKRYLQDHPNIKFIDGTNSMPLVKPQGYVSGG